MRLPEPYRGFARIESLRASDLPVGEACIDMDFERAQQQVIFAPCRDAGSGVQVCVRL